MEKEIRMPQALWEGLRGRKLILAGNACEFRQKMEENLNHISGIYGNCFEVISGLTGAVSGQYVLLFSRPEDMKQLTELLGQLQSLAQMRPAAALLLSDNRVYGRLFGKAHRLTPREIGYICNTAGEDMPAANLRTAEHFACRLAREEGLNIRVARGETSPDGAFLREMAEAAVRLLLKGETGAVYNLPMRPDVNREEHSPLTPIPIVTATGK